MIPCNHYEPQMRGMELKSVACVHCGCLPDVHTGDPPPYPRKDATDYRALVPGLNDALGEIDYKLQRARSMNALNGSVRYHLAYIAALEELENTLKMRRDQAERNERPGLWSTVEDTSGHKR